MGPMAGIGDSLVWGTCKTISLSIATTFALSGNLLAVPVALMFPLVTYFMVAGCMALAMILVAPLS